MMALLAMMAVLFGTTACGDSIFGQTRIKGSGNLITRTVAVGNFHTVDASRGVKVVISDEPGEVEICADDNLIEYVRVGVDDGELKVTVAPRIHAVPSEQILVRVPHNGNIRKLEASSAAKIVSKVQLTGRMLDIEASSAAKIRVDAQVEACEIDASSSAKVVAQIDADRLEADASSASSIVLQGAVQKAAFEASSAASIDARKLIVHFCEAKASSAADIRVYCEQALQSRTSSAGSVSYAGPCSVSSVNTSGGSTRGVANNELK